MYLIFISQKYLFLDLVFFCIGPSFLISELYLSVAMVDCPMISSFLKSCFGFSTTTHAQQSYEGNFCGRTKDDFLANLAYSMSTSLDLKFNDIPAGDLPHVTSRTCVSIPLHFLEKIKFKKNLITLLNYYYQNSNKHS